MATSVSDIEIGFDFMCSVCKGKNKNTAAEKFCSDCNDYYCSSCVKCHSEIPALRNHKIQDTERFKRSSLLTFNGQKICNVKTQSDRNTCCILSACFLDDGTIILSDSDNRKLKRLDRLRSFFIRDCCDVPADPHQVCAITDSEVAVCCCSSQVIQFVSVGSTMRNTRQINTDFKGFGLAYADRKLFISDDKAVYVYTVSGNKLQQFCLDGLSMSRLAVSSDTMKIYVTDVNKGLIILDRNGSPVGFNGPELKKAFDVCILNSDNVLVCGYSSRNILQFRSDGKLIGRVLVVLKGDRNCQAICYDKNHSKLVVGFPFNDEITIYDTSE